MAWDDDENPRFCVGSSIQAGPLIYVKQFNGPTGRESPAMIPSRFLDTVEIWRLHVTLSAWRAGTLSSFADWAIVHCNHAGCDCGLNSVKAGIR